MPSRSFASTVAQGARFSLATLALLQFSVLGPLAGSAQAQEQKAAATAQSPIKHVIVIVGENRSFDHIFATYKPKEGESVDNLLSKEIINPDGTPGKNFALATQYSADITGSTTFQLSPATKKKPYSKLPAPLNGGPTNVCTDNLMCTMADATSSENGLDPNYYESLLDAWHRVNPQP